MENYTADGFWNSLPLEIREMYEGCYDQRVVTGQGINSQSLTAKLRRDHGEEAILTIDKQKRMKTVSIGGRHKMSIPFPENYRRERKDHFSCAGLSRRRTLKKVLSDESDVTQFLLTNSLYVSPFFLNCRIHKETTDLGPSIIPATIVDDLKRIYDRVILGGKVHTSYGKDLRLWVEKESIFRTFSSFLSQSVHIINTLVLNEDQKFEAYFGWLEHVTRIRMRHKVIKSCPGTLFLSPPGTGKTFFIYSHPYGWIDTDVVKRELITDKDFIKGLIDGGISVITNNQHWLNLEIPLVAILPPEEEQKGRLMMKGYFSKGLEEEYLKRKEERKQFFKNNPELASKKRAEVRAAPGLRKGPKDEIEALDHWFDRQDRMAQPKQPRFQLDEILQSFSTIRTSYRVKLIRARTFEEGFIKYLRYLSDQEI